MRCRTKSDFAETYHFGHKTCNSELFSFKIGGNCAYLQGVSCSSSNRLKPVRSSLVQSTFSISECLNCNWRSGFLRFGPVQLWFFCGCCNRTFKHYIGRVRHPCSLASSCYNFRRLRQLSTVVVSKVQNQLSLEECKSWTCIVLLGLRAKVQVRRLSIKD